MPAAAIFKDLSILAKYIQVNHVRLLGGEPLLHPDLIGVIEAVRNSGISKRIRVVTNGLLLWKMRDDSWQHVDEVHVSIYPGKEIEIEKLKLYREKAKSHHVNFEVYYFDYFRESYSAIGADDKALIRRIYNTCLMAHQWHCYNIHDGFFFKCPQSVFLPRFLHKSDLTNQFIDGIRIGDLPGFRKNLIAYLESHEPLASCKYCLGSVGKLFHHEEIPRSEWGQRQNRSTEDLIDNEYLDTLENVDKDADNLCLRSHLFLPENREIAVKSGLIS
jgi:hypothetical protein